ncbi:unnamed protein product [Durusdinium trenchii]|uniref:Uncharacterized protein n=2 Tax=Durusdinium trenchii TaxID=1381693 RepID=A0ABP0SIG3_9DINO
MKEIKRQSRQDQREQKNHWTAHRTKEEANERKTRKSRKSSNLKISKNQVVKGYPPHGRMQLFRLKYPVTFKCKYRGFRETSSYVALGHNMECLSMQAYYQFERNQKRKRKRTRQEGKRRLQGERKGCPEGQRKRTINGQR